MRAAALCAALLLALAVTKGMAHQRGQAHLAGPQPIGFDWDWHKIVHWQFDDETEWGLSKPYDWFLDYQGEEGPHTPDVEREAHVLQALAAEGLEWTALATAEGAHVPWRQQASYHWAHMPLYRFRWAWEAAGGAVRVEASMIVELHDGTEWQAHDVLHGWHYSADDHPMHGDTGEEGFSIFVRDARPAAGPWIAAVYDVGGHPAVLTSRWRFDNSDGSGGEPMFDHSFMVSSTVSNPESSFIAVTWQPPHTPAGVTVDAPRVLRRMAAAVLGWVLNPPH